MRKKSDGGTYKIRREGDREREVDAMKTRDRETERNVTILSGKDEDRASDPGTNERKRGFKFSSQ